MIFTPSNETACYVPRIKEFTMNHTTREKGFDQS